MWLMGLFFLPTLTAQKTPDKTITFLFRIVWNYHKDCLTSVINNSEVVA